MASIDRDTQSITDILRFVCSFEHWQRTRSKNKLRPTIAQKVIMWRRSLMAWMARLADETVVAWYVNTAPAAALVLPPAKIRAGGELKNRKYVQISVEAKWQCLEDARACHTDPATVLRVHSCSPVAAEIGWGAGGTCATAADAHAASAGAGGRRAGGARLDG